MSMCNRYDNTIYYYEFFVSFPLYIFYLDNFFCRDTYNQENL